MTPPAVEVLRCPSCSGAMPFGDADVATCPFCGTQVPLPDAHRELRDANRADASAREEAQAYLAKLSSRPNALMEYLARENVSWALLLLFPIPYGIALIIALVLAGFLKLFMHHSDLWWAWFDAIVATILMSTFVQLGAFGRRKALGRDAVRAALAARPPERPGGPALCRSCGSPLFLGAGILATRCTYCGSDNIVVPDGDQALERRKDRRNVHSAVKYAQDIDREERKSVRGRFIWRAVLLSVPTFAYFAQPISMMPPSYSDTDYRVSDGEHQKLLRDPIDSCLEQEKYNRAYLARGDSATVTNDDDELQLISVWHSHRLISVWLLPPDQQATFVAPSGEFYLFCLTGTFDADDETWLDVTFHRH